MAYLTDDELLDTEDGFTEWDGDTAAGSTEETLEQALAEERLAELESELEQDEHPVDYDAELETEEEEAAPVSEKRLKREIRAEAMRRLEEAARTESDFRVVVDEWNKLDRNRERRERDHENLRGDVPLEYQRKPPWGCAAGIPSSSGTKAHPPVDEQPGIPAADGRELSGHPV